MATLWNRALHYIFVLWFLLSFIFFSLAILSRHRLDVYHTSTHGAGLKHAARGSLKIQDAKNRQKFPCVHHQTTLSGYIFATKARIDNWEKLVKPQYVPHMSSQYGELRPTSS